MGGSAKKARRRASGPALRYEHVAGARRSPRAGQRSEGRERGDWLFGSLLFLTVTVVIVLFALADMAWGATLWGEVAPAWPGGGYGFAITIGLLAPPAAAGIIAPLMRANWRKEKARSLALALAALPGVALSCLLLLLCFGASRPKRRRRGPECYDHGQPCWIHEQYPYLWAPGIAAALLSAGLGCWLAYRYAARRRARLTSPGTAAPSDPPRPGRPTCT
ncbi:hypothetical protein AB0H82_25775 [Streptomyces sp. NPDC050732]|uniref:hypothetical protein n=1 Tax=Streptomyces sp. NPDC050732 TaxID=3154632 RepID=UPI00341926B1